MTDSLGYYGIELIMTVKKFYYAVHSVMYKRTFALAINTSTIKAPAFVFGFKFHSLIRR
jgi:hypothetical protein